MSWFIPMGICLCVAAVQAMRKHWKNSVIALLSAVMFFLLAALSAQSHTSAMRRARETAFGAKIHNLEEQLKQKTQAENRTTH
jgi:hypothetical protein